MHFIMKIFIITLVACLSTGCNTSSKGYATVEDMYEAALTALRSQDRDQVEAFAEAILPDKGSAAYMEKNNCTYRGFPIGLKEEPHAIEDAIVRTTEDYLSLAQSLEATYGSLNDMQFVGFKRKLNPEPLNESKCRCREILYEEPWGIFVFRNRNDTVSLKIGELLKVNGKWKTFTAFKTNP